MRIVFMGTPQIAATCLKALCEAGREIVGVYTKPDTPQKRGMKLTMSAVKEYALSRELAVFQPAGFREDEVVEELKALQPDVIAVVAYGKILPQRVLDIPRLGCVNIHASLLPKLRGAAPIQRAVLNGFPQTGVTAMYMAKELDAGDIIDVSVTDVLPEETSGELTDRLAQLGAALLVKTMDALENGTATRTPQDPAQVTYAAMLSREEAPIDWTQPAGRIHDQIRGLNPWPVAETVLGGNRLRIYASQVLDETTQLAPGTPIRTGKKGLDMACGAGTVLRVLRVQADGGKQLNAPDYFRGHPLETANG